MEQNTINIDELERLAKAAYVESPGPWRRQDFHSDGARNGVDAADGSVVCASYGYRRPAVFDFIAGANPVAILSLIERLRLVEAERDDLAAKLKGAHEQPPAMTQHREPVTDEHGNEVGFTDWQRGPGLPWWPKRELYAIPIPAEQVNALTMALLRSAYQHAVSHDESLPFDWAVHCEVLYQAIASAEAQQAKPVENSTQESAATRDPAGVEAGGQSVNARLLEAAKAALDAMTCSGEADDPGHRCGHCDDYVDRSGVVRAALRDALASAEAQQADSMQLTRESVARAIWGVRREYEDRCDMELEDMGDSHPVWDEADAVLAIAERVQSGVAWLTTEQARNAERYAYLRSQHEGSVAASFAVFAPEQPIGEFGPVGSMPGELDAAIDSAMRADSHKVEG